MANAVKRKSSVKSRSEKHAGAGRLTIPDLAVIVPCVLNSELVKKHATVEDPWGLEYTKLNTVGSGAFKGYKLDRRFAGRF